MTDLEHRRHPHDAALDGGTAAARPSLRWPLTVSTDAARRVAPRASPLHDRLRSLDLRFERLAERFGFRVRRIHGAYVSYVGDGTIEVAPYDDLDADDCLAQIVLHELCHHLVEGPGSESRPDWGLDNSSDAHVERELAALRLQAAVLDRFGLRRALAPTTDFRAWYDRIGPSPLSTGRSGEIARVGLARLWSLSEGVAFGESLRACTAIMRSFEARAPHSTCSTPVLPRRCIQRNNTSAGTPAIAVQT